MELGDVFVYPVTIEMDTKFVNQFVKLLFQANYCHIFEMVLANDK